MIKSVELIATDYFLAWEARDLERVMLLHSVDTVFQSHTNQQVATGNTAVRKTFASLLKVVPDISFKAWDIRFGENFWVSQMTVSGHQTNALGQSVHFSSDSADVVILRNGLVWRKDTYLDSPKLLAALQHTAGRAE